MWQEHLSYQFCCYLLQFKGSLFKGAEGREDKPKRSLGACKGMANGVEVGAHTHCSCFVCAASGLGAIAIELYEPLKTHGQDGRETDVITDIITIKAK